MRIGKNILAFIAMQAAVTTASAQSLSEAYGDYWRTGMSVNQWEVDSNQVSHFPIIANHFNWVVAENCMKMESLQPSEGRFDFRKADAFVDKALAEGLQVVGHCLIWHSQCPAWFFKDKNGKDVTPEVLKKRMREHIRTILGHFRGRVKAWDVVNEAFEDDGSLRQSKFYKILGEDFIPLAFHYAHEADPSIELYYNDYSMNKASKVDGVVRFFKPLMAKGLSLTAIGLQGHMVLGSDDYVAQYEQSIKKISQELGIPVQFTELDLSVLPNPYGFAGANISDNFKYRKEMDPYRDGLPNSVARKAEEFWIDFYKMLIKNRENILRVGFWCFNDANSWRNGFPIPGRTDYATLFDRDSNPKPTIKKLVELVEK